MSKRWRIGLAVLCLAGAATAGVLAGRHPAAEQVIYREDSPADTVPRVSISERLFQNRIPSTAVRNTPPFTSGAISLRLFTATGEFYPDQMSLHVPDRDQLDFFPSFWNYTNQKQSLGVLTFVDHKLVSPRIDGRQEFASYPFTLGPNEALEIPMHLDLRGRQEGLHSLMFLVVRRPEAFAADDSVAGTLCCFVSNHRLWLQEQVPPAAPETRLAAPSEAEPFSFGLTAPTVTKHAIAVKANAPVELEFQALTTASVWQLIGLVDYQQVELNVSEKAQIANGQFTLAATLPPLSAGKHEAFFLFTGTPYEALAGLPEKAVGHSPTAIVRVTIEAK